MSDPQIIHTAVELEALDPETMLMRSEWECDPEPIVMAQRDWASDYTICPAGLLPLAVIATGEQVRAARKALEEDND